MFCMNVVIPKTLQKQVRKHAKKNGVSESEYVRIAVKQALEAEESFADETHLWEFSSLQDFDRFSKRHKL